MDLARPLDQKDRLDLLHPEYLEYLANLEFLDFLAHPLAPMDRLHQSHRLHQSRRQLRLGRPHPSDQKVQLHQQHQLVRKDPLDQSSLEYLVHLSALLRQWLRQHLLPPLRLPGQRGQLLLLDQKDLKVQLTLGVLAHQWHQLDRPHQLRRLLLWRHQRQLHRLDLKDRSDQMDP
jgi:hypothetical protein